MNMKDLVVLARVGKTTNNTFEYTCLSTFSRNQEKIANLDFPKLRKLLDLAGMYYPFDIMHPRTGIQHMLINVVHGKDTNITGDEKIVIINQVKESGVLEELSKGY